MAKYAVKPKNLVPTPDCAVDVFEEGRVLCDTQNPLADLEYLHGVMGYHARMLWDVQHARIAMGNRVKSASKDPNYDPGFLATIAVPAMQLATAERALNRELERWAAKHPMAGWIEAQRGIGLGGFARLLAVTGSLDRFPTVSKLWKYLGLAVIDGHAQRMPKGELASHTNCAGRSHLASCKPRCKRDHHPNCTPDGFGNAYSPRGKVVCRQLADSIVRVGAGGPYRAAYDRMKLYYETERPDWTQGHRDNAARHYAIKRLVQDMWVEWHRSKHVTQSELVPLDTIDLPESTRCHPVQESCTGAVATLAANT